ncbi:dual specificity protein phosphatase 13B isoform X4 [Equus asinus]|uniref:dual specificity protein phosphatase 13B isoform X4 n=2 Tax=Equus asinus TaxID=9793 RepID=UPI0038F725F5
MAEAFLPELRGDAEATPCPSVLELEELLRAGKVSCSHVDEVWPNLYIGDARGPSKATFLDPVTQPASSPFPPLPRTTANNRFELWKLGITHVLNAAHGGLYCQGGPDFYGSSVTYLGVPAPDLPDFDISAYFSSTADFIHRALSTPGGPGALCGRCEPLCHTGPGLPHAAPAPVPAAGSDHREAAPMDLSQPRLPPPALPAGPEAAGCRPELRGQSWSLYPATGFCHFATLALALLVLLQALAQVDTQKMKQHQVCGDRRLEAGSTKCPSEKTTAWARYPYRMDSLQKQDLRRPKIHGAVRVPPYQPPTLASLQRLLWVHRAATLSHINEVWPNLFLGDAYAARDKNKLTQLGITHVVNVAAGKFQVDTGAKFYHGMPLEYYGIEADDNPFFDLSVYFLPVARYIRTALNIPQGRVLVHCAMGVSRSATVVLAFLMIYENMTLVEAIQTVQAHRDICPNSGFLQQLQVLDNRLGRETGRL